MGQVEQFLNKKTKLKQAREANQCAATLSPLMGIFFDGDSD